MRLARSKALQIFTLLYLNNWFLNENTPAGLKWCKRCKENIYKPILYPDFIHNNRQQKQPCIKYSWENWGVISA